MKTDNELGERLFCVHCNKTVTDDIVPTAGGRPHCPHCGKGLVTWHWDTVVNRQDVPDWAVDLQWNQFLEELRRHG